MIDRLWGCSHGRCDQGAEHLPEWQMERPIPRPNCPLDRVWLSTTLKYESRGGCLLRGSCTLLERTACLGLKRRPFVDGGREQGDHRRP